MLSLFHKKIKFPEKIKFQNLPSFTQTCTDEEIFYFLQFRKFEKKKKKNIFQPALTDEKKKTTLTKDTAAQVGAS